MMITIITPSFNQGRFIERTIQSVLSQGYPNLEYIVIDGGSTDETLGILKKYEGRLKWYSEKDTGQSNAINKGFRMARGKILAWLNSDDIYLPGALNKVVRYFASHPKVMMVYGEGYMIDEHDNIKSRFPFTEPKFDLAKLIYVGDYVLQQTTFFRKTVFDSIPMLDESLHFGMDWDLFIRIGKKFSVDYIPDYLGSIREHAEAKTSWGGVNRFRELVKVIRKHGVERYPLAYINYGLDAYAKAWFGEDLYNNAQSGIKGTALARMRDAVRSLASLYAKHVQQEYYTDGWIGRQAMFVLQNSNRDSLSRTLVLEGEAHSFNIPLTIRVTVNRALKTSHVLKEPGQFAISVKIPSGISDSDCYHIRVRNNKTFIPKNLDMNSDSRALGFVLKKIDIM